MNDYQPEKKGNLSDHLSNERTFLSWIRTSIGIMAFGFVVERFALFIKQLSLLLGESHLINSSYPAPVFQGYSAILGICLVAFGALISALAFVHYYKIEKEIENDAYAPSKLLNAILSLGVVVIGIFLVFYLLSSI